jgi:threonylcarbamoyladenosine tRNA methylthiotransferase CDKAL1
MAKIFHDPRIYAYLHCPIQAASDKVLDDMRREYTRADFEYIADYLKEHVPGICIATDLICGFPGETEEDWEETMDLVRKYQFSVLFINQFFPRPGTPAANMKRVPSDKVKLRTKAVSELFRANFPYSNRVGQRYSILVTEHAPDNVHYCGRTKAYEMVLVDPDPRFMGQVVDVEIVSTGKFYMEGKVLDECLARLPSVASSGALAW